MSGKVQRGRPRASRERMVRHSFTIPRETLQAARELAARFTRGNASEVVRESLVLGLLAYADTKDTVKR